MTIRWLEMANDRPAMASVRGYGTLRKGQAQDAGDVEGCCGRQWGVEVWVPLEVKRQIHNGFVVVVSFLMFQSSRETLPDSLQLPSRRSKMVFEAHNTKSGEALESIFFSCLRASLMNGYMYVTICARKNVFRV